MIEPKDFMPIEMVNTKTPKSKKISGWKRRGIICDDWNGLYERLLKATQCELCPKIFTNSRDRQVDHDHEITDAPNVRNIVCQKCNLQKSDYKITNNTGERHICKSFNKSRGKDYYSIKIMRDGKNVYNNKFATLEKAIIKRDLFIKNNPNIYK